MMRLPAWYHVFLRQGKGWSGFMTGIGSMGTEAEMTRLSRSSSRAIGFRSVVVVVAVIILDDDRVLPVMMAALDRARDDDCIAVVMPAPGALAIVVKRLLAMVAVMETLSVPIDDHAVVVVVVPIVAVMSVGLDDDAFVCGSDRRQSQAKCQRAQNHDFHFEFSKTMCCPSPSKHGATALVPVSRLGDVGPILTKRAATSTAVRILLRATMFAASISSVLLMASSVSRMRSMASANSGASPWGFGAFVMCLQLMACEIVPCRARTGRQ